MARGRCSSRVGIGKLHFEVMQPKPTVSDSDRASY